MRVIMRLTLSLQLVAVAAAGCDNSVMEAEPAPLGEVIASWVPLPLPFGIQRADENFYVASPDRARNAFAAASIPGCSGTFIGPNILMSAAHCTPAASTTGSLRLHNPSPQTYSFTCDRLLSTDNDTDLVLLYCPTVPGEVAPGLRFGYADLAFWNPSGSDLLYSIWLNNVGGTQNQPAEFNVMLWSAGQVTNTTNVTTSYGHASSVVGQAMCTSPTQWNNANQVATEVQTSVANAVVGSGSPQFDADTNLLVVGPTTGGGDPSSWRTGLPWFHYMDLGWLPNAVNDTSPADGMIDGKECFNSPFPSTYDSVFSSFGLSAATFRGQLLDGNGDFVIDAQRAIEQSLGEPYRDYMFPWFGSLRNNVQWTLSSGTNINPGNQLMTIPANGTARWRGPKSGASGTYMVSIDAHVSGGTSGTTGEVCLRNTLDCNTFSLTNSDWLRFTFRITNGGTELEPRIRFLNHPGKTLNVTQFRIVRANSTYNFDTIDLRRRWEYTASGSAAPILARGATSGINFSGLVTRSYVGGNWNTRHYGLIFRQGFTHTVCFRHRAESGTPVGKMRLVSWGGWTSPELTFNPTASWSFTCAPAVGVPSNKEGIQIQFDVNAAASYQVDDITIGN